MQLDEILKNCLLALASRYPESMVSRNEAMLDHDNFLAQTYLPLQILALLQVHAPQVLNAPARLVLEEGEHAIYLLDRSEHTPVFRIRCGKSTLPHLEGLRPELTLDETLNNCLLALASRYPESVVDLSEDVPSALRFLVDAGPPACPPLWLIKLLHVTAPELLVAPARLVITSSQRAIYLLDRSERTPAFRIHDGKSTMHCRERLEVYLRAHQVPFQVQQHPHAFRAQQLAEREHIASRMVAKQVIAFADAQMILLVLRACDRVDLEKVRVALGAQEVRLARETEFAATFPDCAIGTMPPFGNLYGLSVYVEQCLTEEQALVFPVGAYTETMRLRYADFARLVHPTLLAFAQAPAEAAFLAG
jgi:Ala-tRNA(Pro) deacylase